MWKQMFIDIIVTIPTGTEKSLIAFDPTTGGF